MEDIENMMKCRAIFLYSIGLLCDDVSMLEDERLNYLLHGFLENYLNDNFEIFNLIYYFKKDEGGNICIYEEEEWINMLYKYLGYLARRDNKKIIKMYDDVGYDVVKRISDLARLFYEYVIVLRNMSLVKVRS
jgi:hypothetical protein